MRILITGPECSGKTTLAKDVSKGLAGRYIPEIARPYLTLTEGKYSFADLEYLAQQQYAIEQLNTPFHNSVMVYDTGALVLKIWAAEVFGRTLEQPSDLASRYDLVILCQPEIPWEPDVLRENPSDRSRLAELYEQELEQNHSLWISVNGPAEARLAQVMWFYQENK